MTSDQIEAGGCAPPVYANPTPGAELSALLEQLQTELKGDKGWDYTEYEKGRIAEKERTISLLQALGRELSAGSGDAPEVVDRDADWRTYVDNFVGEAALNHLRRRFEAAQGITP